jgi:hypothetical protein
MRTPARILRTNSPALTGITKPESGELRRPKISRSRAPLALVEATVAAEALAEAVVEVEAAVAEVVVAAVAAGGDKNKQVVQMLR